MTSPGQDRPSYGQRLLPQLLDELSESNPDRLYASYACSVDVSQGFRDVSFQNMARATNAFAWWMEETFGRSNDFATLSYIGIPDLRTAIIFLASIKCGYKLLLLSQRNAIPTNVLLLQQTECGTLLFSSEIRPIIKGVQAALKTIDCLEVPSLDKMLEAERQYYPYSKTFETAKRNPIVILHSSGSTGIPKPITMTHGTFATIDNDRNLPVVEGRKNGDATIWDFPGGGKFFSPFPPSHLAGFTAIAVRPIYSEASAPIFGPALRPATGSMLKEVMQHQKLRGLYLPPTLAEQLLQEPGGVENFRGLDFVCYAGGPLATAAGDEISKVTDVCQLYGGTETGQIHQLFPSRENWGYMEWHPAEKLRMEPGEDDAYELVMEVNCDSEGISHLNHNFPDMTQYRTRDLFRSHPTKPHLWRFHGRTDDIIVLSNGEKFNPVALEVIIQGHPQVSGALAVGQGRFQAALIVEANSEVDDKAKLEESLWPLVERGNMQLPSQGRISRSKILIASSDKPFRRAGKGTIVRKLTAKDFATEIEALYNEDSLRSDRNDPRLKASYNLEAIQEFVSAMIARTFPGLQINKSDDLYAMGLDSLKTLEIASSLRASLATHAAGQDMSWLTIKIVYSCPSVDQLSAVIFDFLNSGLIPEQKSPTLRRERRGKMSALVDNYTASIPQRGQQTKILRGDSLSVAVIGSTGSLGLNLLRNLLQDPMVSKVYSLNRASDAQQRIEDNLKRLGIAPDYSRLDFLTVRLGEELLGLKESQVLKLNGNVDVIIHNAWKVDFNLPLQAFEAENIRATRNIIDLSIASERQPRVVFISSVASTGNWADVHGKESTVPEAPLQDCDVASSMGYGESKNVAEQILHVASQRSRLPISILRLGQIAGSTQSEDPPWPEQEWVPSLIKSSKSQSVLPDDLPSVDWIPVNLMADIILEVVHSDYKSGDKEMIYNLVNPWPTPWSSLLETIRQHLGPQITVNSIKDWMTILEKKQAIDKDPISSTPVLKFRDFFTNLSTAKGAVRYDVQHGLEISKSMARLESVKPDWMKTWLNQWNF